MSPMLNRPAINRRLRAEAEHKKSTAGETPLVLPDMPDLSMEQEPKKAPAKSRKRPAKRKAANK